MATRDLRSLFLIGACLFAAQAIAQVMPPTVSAAKDADWERLQALVEDGVNPNAIYGDGSTALHWASYHDNAAAAGLLIDSSANVNATTDLGATPLWLAAENGSLEMANLLLEAGADPNIALFSGETIVMTAAQSGNGDVVRALLAAGADPNAAVTREQTALMWAANRGHAGAVAALIEFGANVHARSLVREQFVKSEKEQDSHPAYMYWIEEGGNTALMFAARAGDLRSTQLLVAAGSEINEGNAFGTTPLIMAVHGGNPALLETLLEAGANVDGDGPGHTALHAAVLRGNLATVEVLLAHGADTEAVIEKPTPVRRQTTDYNFHDALIGSTPLWLAARFAEPEIMQALLAAGADPFTVNNVSYPAQRRGENYQAEEGDINLLMAAVGMGHRRLRLSWGTPERRAGQLDRSQEDLVREAVSIALQAGVDPNQSDANGQTALAFARERRYASVAALFEAAGAIE
ncbi:MAG: hypothetical protein F4Y89_10605 [Gammaproteobacteria bacterium]|nr:ankyrin repeat domain-containing protein [Gammaproteobacteria bacterium]MXY90970.1 hypothetical protein [Gammaproteobacteria bacterium]MYG96527.1 hypothetical protein [Gammaproteobacteria bacterium]